MTRRAKRRRGKASPARARPAKDRAVAQHKQREAQLKRFRTIVGFLGLIPLVGSLACDGGLLLFCVPWTWYMGVWAAVFGAFVGLSIRLVRERRQFEAQRPRAS